MNCYGNDLIHLIIIVQNLLYDLLFGVIYDECGFLNFVSEFFIIKYGFNALSTNFYSIKSCIFSNLINKLTFLFIPLDIFEDEFTECYVDDICLNF